MKILKTAPVAVFFMAASSLVAHGSLHTKIEQVTQEIAVDPDNAKLYLRRGEYYRTHSEMKKALPDLEKALRMDGKLLSARLALADLYNMMGKNKKALKTLLPVFKEDPNHLKGLKLRAEICLALGRPVESAADRRQVIALMKSPRPENYLELANSLVTAGKAYRADALLALEQGMEKLGPVVTLQIAAVDLQTSWGNFEEALNRVAVCRETAIRKEIWYLKEGHLYFKMNEAARAAAAFAGGLKAYEELSQHQQTLPANKKLQLDLRAGLETAERLK